MNFRYVLYIVGRLMQVEALLMLVPILTGLIYGESETSAYVIVAVAEGLCGTLLSLKRPVNTNFYAREGFVATGMTWIVMSLVGAVPFVITGEIPDYVNALFEIVSGFTTTGSSIITDLGSISHASLIWRSFSHWTGGMGVLVFAMSILPMGGAQNMYLMKAESPGPSVGKLVPKVKSSAVTLYKIYAGITLLEIILLALGGMDIFSNLCISFGTAGTGGFGILPDSCASYSPYCQWVITVFMIACGVNFSVYYLLLHGKIKQALKCEEARCYILIILAAVVLITLCEYPRFGSFSEAVRNVAFSVGSVITTTGYATVDFNHWGQFSKMILLGLMFCGACAGSTGGGMKVSRMVIYVKSIGKMISQYLHPRSIRNLRFEGKAVDHETLRGTHGFLIAYCFIFAASLLIVSLDGHSFMTNFSAIAATLNNIGPGFDMVGPAGNFAAFSHLSKAVMIFDMLLGRLEIFPLLILFTPGTYRK